MIAAEVRAFAALSMAYTFLSGAAIEVWTLMLFLDCRFRGTRTTSGMHLIAN
jgi:hypothetical protein